jgi:hypothetical protein
MPRAHFYEQERLLPNVYDCLRGLVQGGYYTQGVQSNWPLTLLSWTLYSRDSISSSLHKAAQATPQL